MNQSLPTRRKIYLLFLCQTCFACFLHASVESNDSFAQTVNYSDWNLVHKDTSFTIIPSPNNTYGYEIRIKNKLLIRQLTIPSMEGISGFTTKTDAEKVALLVIEKLSKGIMPPTIDKKELIALKINFNH